MSLDLIMTLQEKKDAVAKLMKSVTTPHQILLEIQQYEQHYGCSTAEIVCRIEDGTQCETAEICHWLMLADIVDLHHE